MGALDRSLAALLPLVPKPIVGRVARRYLGGESLESAVAAVQGLNRDGLSATLNLLGEHAERPEETRPATQGSLDILRAISERKLDANLSVKPTQIGLLLDRALFLENIRALVLDARSRGIFVRLDMESSSCTDATLDAYRELRREHENVGIVLQARLRRTLADVRALAALKPRVRLCKGIYVEPHEVAYTDGELINRNYAVLLEELLASGSHVGIATHDERLIYEAYRVLDRLRVPRDGYEFQMLLGVRPDLWRMVRRDGHRLRIYVPFGPEWYAYSVRRLRENPAIAGHVFRALFRRDAAPNGVPAVAAGGA
ncbi:MAG: proline dehydrogenase family protein [Planctomycetales bacterium]|nr:proline dehydrogenase family protein [Planctomycetales bacterium]